MSSSTSSGALYASSISVDERRNSSGGGLTLTFISPDGDWPTGRSPGRKQGDDDSNRQFGKSLGGHGRAPRTPGGEFVPG